MLNYIVSENKKQLTYNVDLYMLDQFKRNVAKGFMSKTAASKLAEELNLAFAAGQEYAQLIEDDG